MVPAYWDFNIFTGASMTFFAYTCQVQMLPIYSELVNPSYKRMKKVIQRSIATDFLFYLVIAVAGYLSQFNSTAQIVLERPGLPGSDTDYALLIAVVSVMACIMVAFPVNYNPFRQHFFNCVFGKEEFSQTENIILTTLFVAITCVVSIVFPNVKQVISIMGGLIAVSMCYLIPVICQIKLSKHGMGHPSNLLPVLFFGCLIVTGYTSVAITVYEIIAGIETMPRNK